MPKIPECFHYRIPKASFQDEFKEGVGGLIINGLELPHSHKLDPLAELWSSGLKKEIFRRHGVDVTAVFNYSEMSKTIFCSLILNYGAVWGESKIAIEFYNNQFSSSFNEQIILVKDTIRNWLFEEENGYLSYLDLFERDRKLPEVEIVERAKKLFNDFSVSEGLRTKEDEEASAAKKKAIKKASSAAATNKNPV